MPVDHGCSGSLWSRNPQLWQRCRVQAEKEMLAAGWIPRSKKFPEVQMRKAHQLFAKSV
jgi:hypothetical protein